MNSPSDDFAAKLRTICSGTPPDYTAPEMTARLVHVARNELAFGREVVIAEIHRQWDLHDAFGTGISPIYVPGEEDGAVEPWQHIAGGCCPYCGANLSVEHGDEPRFLGDVEIKSP